MEEENFRFLFSPVRIGQAVIKNRLVFPSMCTFYSDDAGSITPRIREFVRARAAGGVGMFILPGTPYGPPSKARASISQEQHLAGWKSLKEMASTYGMSLVCQLHPFESQFGNKLMHPHDYPLDEIHSITQAYAEGAARARRAGLDGVELHGAHAHEISQFLSPFYNRRRDEYGGNLAARSRFAVEIIHSIKKLAGGDFPVIFRFSVEERVPGGRDLAESLQLARLLEEAGADALHASIGMIGSEQWTSAPMDVPAGFFVHLAAEIKKTVHIPVIAVGRINDLNLAAKVVNEGQADLVAMGRALLAEPELPRKSMEGRTNEICRCIYCNQGCGSGTNGGALCLQNPRTGREADLHFTKVPVQNRKTVLVVGAGPAGLEAARDLAEKGNDIKLYEQRSEAGGTFLLASRAPFKDGFSEVIRYRMNIIKSLGVETYFNREVDLKTIQNVSPDVVILATGSSPTYPSFPIEGKAVYTPDEVLLGIMPQGKKILVVGGGMVGAEIADYLANLSYKVEIAEQLSSIAGDLHMSRRFFLLQRLEKRGVKFLLNTKVLMVSLPKVMLAKDGGQETRADYDSIVLATGRRPNNKLGNLLKKRSVPFKVFTVGDANYPRTALEAIHEAALIAAAI